MALTTCAICFLPIEDRPGLQYHQACCQTLFDQKSAPVIRFSQRDIRDIAKQELNRRVSITGVQPKISLNLSKNHDNRLTIVAFWGNYILKPQHFKYRFMPELEAISMRLARNIGIKTALSGLIKLKSGEWAYIAKRFDRYNNRKLAMEDMCQVTEKLTEDKYQGSVEQVGKAIYKYASSPGLEMLRLFELVLFNFIIGNSDMHLKNYALLQNQNNIIELSPAYDLLPSILLETADTEETALTINGKKRKLSRTDFLKLGARLNIPEKVVHSTITNTIENIQVESPLLDSTLLETGIIKTFKNQIQTKISILL